MKKPSKYIEREVLFCNLVLLLELEQGLVWGNKRNRKNAEKKLRDVKPNFPAFHAIVPLGDILELGKSHAGMQWSREIGNCSTK